MVVADGIGPLGEGEADRAYPNAIWLIQIMHNARIARSSADAPHMDKYTHTYKYINININVYMCVYVYVCGARVIEP